MSYFANEMPMKLYKIIQVYICYSKKNLLDLKNEFDHINWLQKCLGIWALNLNFKLKFVSLWVR